jgi:hypothetical protein
MLRCVAFLGTDTPWKSRFLQESQGVSSLKTAVFIVTAVKTSNLTMLQFLYNRLPGGREVISFEHRLHFTPKKVPDADFC